MNFTWLAENADLPTAGLQQNPRCQALYDRPVYPFVFATHIVG
jgi:hypothetical protein